MNKPHVEDSVTEQKILCKCEVCGRQYQHGPQRYEGHYLELYGILCCDSCWVANWDGWAPHYEAVLLGHLRAKNLPAPMRNEKGLLPRG